MRTSSEIKKNNIRKANLVMESSYRKDKGSIANKFGLYEQCGTQLDMDGEYMGAPVGTEPMDMISGDEMGMMDFDMGMDMMDDGMGMMGGEQVDCPKCGGEGCSHCNNRGSHGMGMMDDDDMPMSTEMVMQLMGEEQMYGGGCHCPCEGTLSDPTDPMGGEECRQDCCTPLQVANIEKCGSLQCSDRSDFDGRDSEVIGVDSNIKKQRKLKENYKALTATPSRDSWGNKYNNILTESNQVNGVNSLINRMKQVIK